MINVLLKFFMFIINTFSTLLLNPIFTIINAFFPIVSSGIFTTLINVFNMGFNLFAFFLDLFMVPSNVVILYLSLCATILVFNLTIRAYAFGLAVYHYYN